MNNDQVRSIVRKNKFKAIAYFFVFSIVFITISWLAGSLADFRYVIAGSLPFLLMVLILGINFCEKVLLDIHNISESE